MTTQLTAAPADTDVLLALNADYIKAFLTADAAWYDAHLVEDFIEVRSDGSVLDKPAFLANTTTEAYDLEEVAVRVHGDAAYVTALGTWRTRDGATGQTRYIDSYAKLNGEWKVISAQLTRITPPTE